MRAETSRFVSVFQNEAAVLWLMLRCVPPALDDRTRTGDRLLLPHVTTVFGSVYASNRVLRAAS